MDDQKVSSDPQDLSVESAQPTPSSVQQPNSKKPLIIAIGIILAVLVLIGGYLLYNQNRTKTKIASINNFEDCKKAGYPMSEMYLTCKTPDGRTFTDITLLTLPFVNQSSPKPTQSQANITYDWKIYTIKSFGLEYKLPPKLSKFGEQTENIRKGAEGGTAVDISLASIHSPLTENPNNEPVFAFGSRSNDFQEGREYGFLDSWGYENKSGKFYGVRFLSTGIYSGEIPSGLAQVFDNSNGVKILKITGKNYLERGVPIEFNPGVGRIGALVNIPNNKTYVGFAVEMGLNNEFTEKDFDQILSTFKFIDQTVGEKTCTQEAKTCSDGSSVGRAGPKCEFAACPK